MDKLKIFRAPSRTDSDGNRLIEALVNVLKEMRKANDAAVSDQQFELAAWIGQQEQNLIDKFNERDDSTVKLGKFLRDRHRDRHEESIRLFKGFGQQAFGVINSAKKEAHRTGHNHIGTEQILLGLIAGPTSIIDMIIVQTSEEVSISQALHGNWGSWYCC